MPFVWAQGEEEECAAGFNIKYGVNVALNIGVQMLFEYMFNNDVVGIGPEIPEMKKESEFITPEQYQKYMEKFEGKELLIVYAGNFRYRVDANTGEIYGKSESR